MPPRLPLLQDINYQIFASCSLFLEGRIPCACHTTTIEPAKWRDRTCGVLSIFTSKRASHHSGVLLLTISNAKMAPEMVCFEHMASTCAPGRSSVRLLTISILTVSRSYIVYIHFWLPHVHPPRCLTLFQQLNFQKLSDNMPFFIMLISKCASCHHTTCNFSSLIGPIRWLPTRGFSEPTFPPSAATNHWKNKVFPTCLPSAPSDSIFFLLLLWTTVATARQVTHPLGILYIIYK